MEPFQLCNSQITITKNLFGKIFWRTEKEDVQEQVKFHEPIQSANLFDLWIVSESSVSFRRLLDEITKTNGVDSSFGIYAGRKIFLQPTFDTLD